MSELIQTVTNSKNDETTLNAFYILSNHVFMKNINAKSPSFSADVFKTFRLDFDQASFVNKKFTKMPSFPFFKLFLQNLSHNFNNREEMNYFYNIDNINKI